MRKSVYSFGLLVALLLTANLAFAQNGRPLTLDECVKLALDNNSQLLNAERRVHVAESGVTIARANLLPRVNANLASSRSREVFRETRTVLNAGKLFQTAGTYYNFHRASISLNQTVFDFGATWNSIRQANFTKEASDFTFQTTKQTTILSVHERYYQLLKDLRLLEVAREAVRQNEEQLKLTESRYEIGAAPQGEVFKTKTALGDAKISLIQQENAVRNSRAALNVVLGRNPDVPLEVTDLPDVDVTKSYDMNQVMQKALQSNPGLRRYDADMKAASQGVKMARTQFLPTLSLNATYSRSDPNFDPVYSNFDKTFNASISASVSWNLFNGFADKAEIDRESANYRIARENQIEQERLLRQQVQQAMLNLEATREISTLNKDNLVSAEEDLRLAQERYRVGAGTLLDVITAQVSLTRAQSTLVRAKYDAKIAEAQLEEAMGTLGQ
jgi:TolC family type I secretion outer membrane protein